MPNKLFRHPNYKLLPGPLLSWCFNTSFDVRCFSERCRPRRRGVRPMTCARGFALGEWRRAGWGLGCWCSVGFTTGRNTGVLKTGQAARPVVLETCAMFLHKGQCQPVALPFKNFFNNSNNNKHLCSFRLSYTIHSTCKVINTFEDSVLRFSYLLRHKEKNILQALHLQSVSAPGAHVRLLPDSPEPSPSLSPPRGQACRLG